MMNRDMVFNSERAKNSVNANQNPGKLKFTELPHENMFFRGRPAILHPVSTVWT